MRQSFTLIVAFFLFLIAGAQNPIVLENERPGNPRSEWDISGAGDLSIQGFATDISVNLGETVYFKIKTEATSYNIDIYRLGYYNGAGARKVGTGNILAPLPQTQPDPLEDLGTGLVDCGNWDISASWEVPDTLVSGVYIAKLTRTDVGGDLSSHIIFVVRDDASTSDLFFQTSDATWQAYNGYGGNSFYVGGPMNGHATKISYNRPFLTRGGGGGGTAEEDWIFNAEYPMIRFLERNGYNISYTTNVDAARNGNLIQNHKVFLSVGHDEYWSAEQRNNVEAARNAGVHLAFFSGNEVYWKTRWENSIDPSGSPYRTLVCYKEGTLGEKTCGIKCDPDPNVWTGLWRTGENYDAGKPENSLTGQISWDGTMGAIKVPAKYKNLRFWRNTSITTLGPEDIATFPFGTLGYEWNWEQYPESNPHGRFTLSSTTLNGKTHKLSLYRDYSGALVFGAGTVQWAWGLDSAHLGGPETVDIRMQQATVNLFADMHVQPETLEPALIPATPSTDESAPQSVINTPEDGVELQKSVPVTISGTSSDFGGGVIASIEVSTDGGTTWEVATGTTNWTYTWTPLVQGEITIKVRGIDDSGNMESNAGSNPNKIVVTVGPPPFPNCPCTLFPPTSSPAANDLREVTTGIELGIKLRSDYDGYITGLRFYKSPNNTGTHIGSLWTLDGQLLGRATFTNESESGWQEVSFVTPVPVTAGTLYVASYHSPTGYYSQTDPFFQTRYFNNPLTAISTSNPNGPNGIYSYTSSPAFPTSHDKSNNYWVDVVFNTSIAPDVTAPTIQKVLPLNNAAHIKIAPAISATFNEPLDPATVNSNTFELRDASNAVVAATVSYNNGLYRIILAPSAPLNHLATYTVIVKGGANGVKDVAGNALAADYTWSFTTEETPPPPPINGPGGPILVISAESDPFTRYTVEILRAEGLNSFAAADISTIDETVLNNYDVVILGKMPLTTTQASMFTTWVNAGGTLIAFKPATQLSSLMGINQSGGKLGEKYLLINSTGPGFGIVNQTIQFHDTATLYTLNGATSLAQLYSTATKATVNPAVTMRQVGSNGGRAIAFAYDFPKSIIYTRQGNPKWAGQRRDAQAGPIRSDNLFYGNSITDPQPDWIDLNKVAIPQADEQQRFLANIILQSNLHRKPLPRFWYLPADHKAVIVMTGDDHASNGTENRFNHYLNYGSNTPQDVADWKAVRGSSYLFNNTPLSEEKAQEYEAQGFELGLHLNTGCEDFTPESLEADLSSQLSQLASQYPGIAPPVTNRTHCVAWSDWATSAKLQAEYGIRLDANYYYWPASWVQNRPGMFTGSGMAMRFADLDGSLIDCYQLATQLTDESGLDYTPFTNQLLDKAIGTEGYYGAFCANMHTDDPYGSIGSDAIVASAKARNVPVISAKQLLTWLDGRNNSSFDSLEWVENELRFKISAANGSHNLRGMLPIYSADGQLAEITKDGNIIPFTSKLIKGIEYGFFDATDGNYVATYGPVITGDLTGTILLQGRPAPPHQRWSVPLHVDLYSPSNNTTPLYSYNVTTDQSGHFTINNVPPGTYNITIKNTHTLKRVMLSQTVTSGGANITVPTLLEGDLNSNNIVNLSDFVLLLRTYNKPPGSPEFDIRADFNGDGLVNLSDFVLMLGNYNKTGESPQ